MFTLASVERYTRSEMVSIMDSDFMELARRIQSKYGLETEDRSKLQRAFE